MHILRLLSIAAAVALCGCASVRNADYAVAPLNKAALGDYEALVKALQTASGSDAALVDKACFGTAFTTPSAEQCRAARNQAMAALVMGSETMCVDHRRSIYGNEASANIALGSMTNLFAGAASVVTSVHGKSVLAALALFSNSERSLVNETVYKQMLVTAVDRKIVELRDVKGQALYNSLKLPITDYSMHEALRDLTAFHASCSFMTGLEKALDEGTQGGEAQKRIRLQAQLASVATQMAGIDVTQRGPTGIKQEQYTALVARHKKISAAIESLEGI